MKKRYAELVIWFEVLECWFNELGFAVDAHRGYFPSIEDAHFHRKDLGKFYNYEEHAEYLRRRHGPAGYFICERLVAIEGNDKVIGFLVDNSHNVRLNKSVVRMHAKVVA